MSAMTTAAIVRCPELPPSGLTQAMHNPTKALHLRDILSSPGVSGNDDGLGVSISKRLIADAVKRLHPMSVGQVFPRGGEEDYPAMPIVQVVPTNRTSFWQFGAIWEDEGKTEGHYGVHDSIFLTATTSQCLEGSRQWW